MEFDDAYLERIVANPSERLDVELKRWMAPSTPECAGKIVTTEIPGDTAISALGDDGTER